MKAASKGRLETARCLLDHGADVNRTSNSGYTALHYAAAYGRLPVVRLLRQRGADPQIKNTDGYTPADCARLLSHPIIAAWLDRTTAEGWTDIHFACERRCGEAELKELLRQGGAEQTRQRSPRESPFPRQTGMTAGATRA